MIGLCKAVEVELVHRLLEPLRQMTESLDLSTDVNDKDLKTVARYCAGRTLKSPEIGSISYFLLTAINSSERRQTSQLIMAFLRVTSKWAGSNWVLDPSGLHDALDALSQQFRNPAAHTSRLDGGDYEACRDVVVGSDGLLWRLALAVGPHAKGRPTSAST